MSMIAHIFLKFKAEKGVDMLLIKMKCQYLLMDLVAVKKFSSTKLDKLHRAVIFCINGDGDLLCFCKQLSVQLAHSHRMASSV